MMENLKDLKSLLKLLRAQGVTEFNKSEQGFLHIKLGELPKAMQGDVEEIEEDSPMDILETPLSPEELVAFANGAG